MVKSCKAVIISISIKGIVMKTEMYGKQKMMIKMMFLLLLKAGCEKFEIL